MIVILCVPVPDRAGASGSKRQLHATRPESLMAAHGAAGGLAGDKNPEEPAGAAGGTAGAYGLEIDGTVEE